MLTTTVSAEMSRFTQLATRRAEVALDARCGIVVVIRKVDIALNYPSRVLEQS